MRDTFVNTLLNIAQKNPRIHLLTGDLGFGVLKPFWDKLPNQITNVGIAEQNMTSFATGMALEGKIVFTYSIGNFPTLRTLEQIRNDAAYHNANVKIICVGGGFVYGALGMSHHATEDLSIMRSLPNVKVFAPADLVETSLVTQAIVEENGVCYLRLGRGGEKRIHQTIPNFVIGKAIEIQSGNDFAIFSTGAIFEEVQKSYNSLKEYGFSPYVYTFPTVKPIDEELIKKIAQTCKMIVTIEENNTLAGFGSAVSEIVSKHPYMCKVVRIGIEDQYSSIVGNQEYLRDAFNLSSVKITQRILKEWGDNENLGY